MAHEILSVKLNPLRLRSNSIPKQISRKEFQMKEVQSPKKPLLYYYVIITAVIILFNLILTPTLMKKQITDVDYGTFMAMINDKNIGKVDIDDSKILFTDKEFCKYHPIFLYPSIPIQINISTK